MCHQGCDPVAKGHVSHRDEEDRCVTQVSCHGQVCLGEGCLSELGNGMDRAPASRDPYLVIKLIGKQQKRNLVSLFLSLYSQV